jgi:hypothetical protein
MSAPFVPAAAAVTETISSTSVAAEEAIVVDPMDLTVADVSAVADLSTVTETELDDGVVQPHAKAAATSKNGD